MDEENTTQVGQEETTTDAKKHRGGKSDKPVLSTGKAGRPIAARVESKMVAVITDGGVSKEVPVEIKVPEKADLVISNIEVVTRKQYESPSTLPERVALFDKEYFDRCNLNNRHPKMLGDKRLLVQYILYYIKPQKVLVGGCAAGDEILAYKEQDIDCIGQDITDVCVYADCKSQVVLGEVYQVHEKYPDCDTVQLLEVFQYMAPNVSDATIRFLLREKAIKYLVVSLDNKGYELQDNPITQKILDEKLQPVFKKVNDADDYRFRAIDLVKHIPGQYQVYGLMPSKMLWIYERA